MVIKVQVSLHTEILSLLQVSEQRFESFLDEIEIRCEHTVPVTSCFYNTLIPSHGSDPGLWSSSKVQTLSSVPRCFGL